MNWQKPSAFHARRFQKWKLGTATPTLENLVLISKLYGVSVDFLVDGKAESDFDTPTVMAAEAYSNYKFNNKRIVPRIFIAAAAAACAVIIGVVNHSVFTSLLFLMLTGTAIVIYLFFRWLLYRNPKH